MVSKNKHLTLDLAPELVQKTLDLIHESFVYEKKYRFDVDFFPLFNKDNFHNIHILINESNQVVASIGFLPKKLKFKNKLVSVGFLGGIAVTESVRGQGVFKDFFNEILKIYEEKVAMFFLWSNLYEMYKKFDFHLSGEFYEYQSSLALEKQKAKKISEFTDGEWNIIKKTYNENYSRYLTVERSESDWEKIKKISSVNGHLDNENYYFFNKGQDLLNTVHEFGGKDLSALSQAPYSIWSPSKLNLNNETKKTLALIKISSPKLFLSFIDNFFGDKLKIESLSVNEVKFTFEDKSFVEPVSSFLTLLFGPNPVVEFQSYLPPLFIAGVDSI